MRRLIGWIAPQSEAWRWYCAGCNWKPPEVGAQVFGIVIESLYGRDGEVEINQSDNEYSPEEPGTNWEKKNEKEHGNSQSDKGAIEKASDLMQEVHT